MPLDHVLKGLLLKDSAAGVPVIGSLNITRDLLKQMATSGVSADETGVVVISMLVSISNVIPESLVTDSPPEWVVVAPSGYELEAKHPAVLLAPADADGGNPAHGGHIAMTADGCRLLKGKLAYLIPFIGAVLGAKPWAWIRDLVACNQRKPLKYTAIQSYFKERAGTPVNGNAIMPIIAYLSRAWPNLMSDDDVRGTLTATTFMEYHTSFSSTAHLCGKMLASLGDRVGLLFSDDEIAAVGASSSRPDSSELNALIPKRVTLAAWCFLSAIKSVPDGWVQGRKIADESLGSERTYWLDFFRKMEEIKKEDSGIEKAKTADKLFDVMVPLVGAGVTVVGRERSSGDKPAAARSVEEAARVGQDSDDDESAEEEADRTRDYYGRTRDGREFLDWFDMLGIGQIGDKVVETDDEYQTACSDPDKANLTFSTKAKGEMLPSYISDCKELIYGHNKYVNSYVANFMKWLARENKVSFFKLTRTQVLDALAATHTKSDGE